MKTHNEGKVRRGSCVVNGWVESSSANIWAMIFLGVLKCGWRLASSLADWQTIELENFQIEKQIWLYKYKYLAWLKGVGRWTYKLLYEWGY